MFLIDSDYNMLVSPDDLDVLQSYDENVRENAEKTAIEQIKGYLRSRYDVDALFDDVDEDERHPMLIACVVDIVLYTLYSSLPGRMMPEIRQIRYDNVINWLKDVHKGIVVPDFPTVDDDDGEDINNPLKWGSNSQTAKNTNY